jgi:DnaJ domain
LIFYLTVFLLAFGCLFFWKLGSEHKKTSKRLAEDREREMDYQSLWEIQKRAYESSIRANAQMENLRRAANQYCNSLGGMPFGNQFGQYYDPQDQYGNDNQKGQTNWGQYYARSPQEPTFGYRPHSHRHDEQWRSPEEWSRHLRDIQIDPKLQQAFIDLGIQYSSSIEIKEIKKAYRKLMNKHHPDKRAARGLPEGDSKEMTQKIISAYELIRESKGFK